MSYSLLENVVILGVGERGGGDSRLWVPPRVMETMVEVMVGCWCQAGW